MKISVLICGCNIVDTIEYAINSVVNQTCLPEEIVYVDDGSCDGSAKLVQTLLRDSSIKLKIIQNKVNVGLTKSLNIGLRECSCTLIARLDADDFWLPTHIEYGHRVFETCPSAFLVGFRATGASLWQNRIPYLKLQSISSMSVSDNTVYKKISRLNLLMGNPFSHSSIIFKNIQHDTAIKYNETFKVSQDYALYACLFDSGKLMINSKCNTAVVVERDNSISKQKRKEQLLNSIKVKKKVGSNNKLSFFLACMFCIKEWIYLRLLRD